MDVVVKPRLPVPVEPLATREDRGGGADRRGGGDHLMQRGRELGVMRQPVAQCGDLRLERLDPARL